MGAQRLFWNALSLLLIPLGSAYKDPFAINAAVTRSSISNNPNPNPPSSLHHRSYQSHNYNQQQLEQQQQHQTRHHQPHQQQRHSPSAIAAGCDVPTDFWCDSYELARRCNVVQQCEQLKQNHQPITVTLMYEALCPYCQRFVANNLGALHSRFGSRVHLELIPWGNSILLRNGQISCNHGPKECNANRLMSCVVDEVPNDQAIPFVICFERSLSPTTAVEQAMQQCSSFIRNSYKRIKQCYMGERGLQLQRQAAHRTMSAKANPIIEVPYILVNGYSPNTDANTVNIVALSHLIQKWLNLRGGP